jgi:dihydropteroate synthase
MIQTKDMSFKAGAPVIMGILNVTPDSFSDGGRFLEKNRAVDHALSMIEEGADIIDIGGESSRPGSDPVRSSVELERVIPVIEGVRKHSLIPISIDTTKSAVAKAAIDAGANMINDISAGRFDPLMFETAAKAGVPICLMHMKETPKTMQENPVYKDLMNDIAFFLRDAAWKAEKAGVKPENIIIDPGIGFGKTPQDNVKILKNLYCLKNLGKTIMIGPSRKSFIGRLLNLALDKRLEATLATLQFAYQNGAKIFRVHDVAPAKRFLSMVEILNPIASPL